MYFIQNSTLLSNTGHGKGGGRQLRSQGSIASLVHLVRNPIEAVEGWCDGLTKEERAWKQRVHDRKQILYLNLRNATNYNDWQAAATELDEIEGNNAWKSVFDSPDYDAGLVQTRLRQLDEARISCDVGRMLFLVRTALARGLGEMGNLKLYKHTHIGTKDLIERYITSALETLDALLDVSERAKCDGLESKHILEQVLSARQAFGRSALLLSGGATLGLNHIGVIKALWEARLLPRIISGASAGSIVCAVLCTRTDEEVPDLLEDFCHGDLAVFEEEGNEDSVLKKVARFLKFGALFDISHLIRVMQNMLGDMTFQEAYNRTRRILNICVSSASLYELPRLLNYVTAPNVLIWSAVAASCSVPFIFSAASLLAKDLKTGEAVPWNPSPQRWIDGSVDNDLPMTRLAEMFNVNHFIVSQVNPHVVPFLVKEEDSIAQEAHQSTLTLASGPSWLRGITELAKGEALHRMQVMAEMGIFPNTLTKTVSVLSQKYSGDITILPEISYADFPRMLSNPTPEFMNQAMLGGERATWPKLSRIRNHCAIELALDDAVQKLRTRVVFSPSQVNLRSGGTHSRSISEEKMRGGKRQEGRRQRKMSQTSEPGASAGRCIRGAMCTRSSHAGYQDAGTAKHPSLRLVKHLVIEPFSHTLENPPNRPFTAAPLLSHPQYDMLSSEAETSQVATSDSESDPPSSTESPYPPPSPVFSPRRPTARHLFPYASQPTSPATDRSSSTFPTLLPKSKYIQTTPPIRGILSSAASLAMTPTTKPSSAELTYKRLFHQTTNHPQVLTGKPVVKSPKTGVQRLNALGLEIDISGPERMLMRKKRGD
ncbi:MAG: hypothetical protein Q9187_001911 [Circinaria calcarea]